MLEDPGLDRGELTAALRDGYGIEPTAFCFVPGYDMRAASYEVAAASGRFFLKVRLGPFAQAPLEVPRALMDAGIENVLAPIRTLAFALWHPMPDDRAAVLYRFVAGLNAVDAGMTADQWRTFGTTLRAVHDGGLAGRFAHWLPTESFALPSATLVREALSARPPGASPAAERLAGFLASRAGAIGAMLERAASLATVLRTRSFEPVLCHADIHAANILVADDGRILLVDWDGPMLAPRERDLLFVIGSRIARTVEPHEEAWFFEGYGSVAVDPEAIVYYRYKRILEDIGEAGRSVFDDPGSPESSRQSEVQMVEGFFAPGGIIETAEEVTLPRLV